MKSVLDFYDSKKRGQPITMLTCYDYWSARILSQSEVDCLLVGDSVAMAVHGAATPIEATIEMMALHTKAVTRGAPKKLVIADMPFMSYKKSLADSLANAEILMKSGAQALKLEGADGNEAVVRTLVESGVPVMGHLGLTPQSVHAMGGFRVQGKTAKQAEKIQQDALRLQEWGVFSLVLECVPASLARIITESLEIPTIGIGAGPDTSGQVLVLQDMLGAQIDFNPKFVRAFSQLETEILQATKRFRDAVHSRSFPNVEESYE